MYSIKVYLFYWTEHSATLIFLPCTCTQCSRLQCTVLSELTVLQNHSISSQVFFITAAFKPDDNSDNERWKTTIFTPDELRMVILFTPKNMEMNFTKPLSEKWSRCIASPHFLTAHGRVWQLLLCGTGKTRWDISGLCPQTSVCGHMALPAW